MRALRAAELLDAWERGAALPPVQRAVALLAAACPGTPAEALADWSVGRRDAELLCLREQTFGPHLAAVADCSGCGERLELAFDAAEIRAGEAADGELSLSLDGWEVRFRLPTSRDLAALATRHGPGDARQALLGRCLLSVHRHGDEADADLPETLAAAVEERMAAADPQARVLLDLSCPSCGRRWQAPFDIDAYFWSELDAWARRTLREVHGLASAYGWSEAEILELSAARRHLYLEMAGS